MEHVDNMWAYAAMVVGVAWAVAWAFRGIARAYAGKDEK